MLSLKKISALFLVTGLLMLVGCSETSSSKKDKEILYPDSQYDMGRYGESKFN